MPTTLDGFVVFGDIEGKWLSLGGPEGPLGHPVSNETPTFDGIGRFQDFAKGMVSWHPETGAHIVWGAIRARWFELGRESFGYPITDELTTPDGRGRFNHFRTVQLPDKPENSIYWTPETGAHAVWGGIRSRWAEIGWERSFLGYPASGEVDFSEGGRVVAFEHGAIYWWPDTGAIELNDVVVHYTGLYCFGETDSDQLSNSDEPYAVLGMVSPTGSWAARSKVYEDVDDGDSRPDLLEIYRGKPGGLVINVLMMEHDEGNMDAYKDEVRKAVEKGFEVAGDVIDFIPVIGPIFTGITDQLPSVIKTKVADFINNILDFGDDQIGHAALTLTPKQMVVLSARTPNADFWGIGWKLETPLLSGDGASYKAYFSLVPA